MNQIGPQLLEINFSELCRAIELFIKNSLTRMNRDGVVIGLSGGLDSAIAATLTVRSLGTDKVHLINMPDQDSKPIHQNHARQLADKLGVDAVYFQPLELVGIEERQELLVGDLAYEEFAREISHGLHVSQQHQVQTNLEAIYRRLPVYWKKYQMEMRQEDTRTCILPWFSSYPAGF